jgi:hypothetical protein
VKKLLALALLLALVAPAYAGIIIKKNGKVFLGTFDAADVSSRGIMLHRVHLLPGEAPIAGDMFFGMNEIRWFDLEANAPTGPYYKAHREESLDPAWAKHRQDWIDSNEKDPGYVPPVLPPADLSSPIKKDGPGFQLTIRKPAFWTVAEHGEILTLEPREKNARIHVFASDVTGERALAVTRAALERIGAHFDAEAQVGNGVEWSTTIRVHGKTLKAVRKVIQMTQGTGFAIAYAEARDWPVLEKTLTTSLETFEAQTN